MILKNGNSKAPMTVVTSSQRSSIREKEYASTSRSSIHISSSNTNVKDIDFVSESEVWENQSWRPVRRIWASPLGVPKFSDPLNEPISQSEERWAEMVIEPGWEWVSELQVDKSRRYGMPDEEGWMYGISFESLIDQINIGQAEEQTSSSIVRRRRFVRSKKCVAPGMYLRMYICMHVNVNVDENMCRFLHSSCPSDQTLLFPKITTN